jgi:hypothetical protein
MSLVSAATVPPRERIGPLTTPTLRRLALTGTAAAAVTICGAVVAVAVTPEGGAYLRAPTSHKYQGRATAAFVKVSGSGDRVAKFYFPACDGKNKNPILKSLKISGAGKFSGEKKYREVHKAARTGRGSDWDTVYDWKVWVKGRFTAPTKAKGTLSSSYTGFLRDSDTGERAEGSYTCKTGKTTWKGKPAP